MRDNFKIQSLEQELEKRFSREATGHDWFHIQRVRHCALEIQEKEGGNRVIIELAALLHDISDHKFNGGDFDKGAVVSREMLDQFEIDERTKNAVTEIVKNVSFKGSGESDKMKTLEGKIVQDADRLDAIGAIGIARTFAYGGAIGNPIYDPNVLPIANLTKDVYKNNRSHTINHFYEKLLLLKDRMHTQTARRIANERTDYMKGFLFQFYKEWDAVEQTTIHEKKP